jgi:hypothetical protein
MRRADSMRPCNRCLLPTRVAPNRTDPDTALTAFWLTRPAILCSRDSVRLHCGMHHSTLLFPNPSSTQTPKMSLTRSGHLNRQDDTAFTRLMPLALGIALSGNQKTPPVAVSAGQPRRNTVTFITSLIWRTGERRVRQARCREGRAGEAGGYATADQDA